MDQRGGTGSWADRLKQPGLQANQGQGPTAPGARGKGRSGGGAPGGLLGAVLAGKTTLEDPLAVARARVEAVNKLGAIFGAGAREQAEAQLREAQAAHEANMPPEQRAERLRGQQRKLADKARKSADRLAQLRIEIETKRREAIDLQSTIEDMGTQIDDIEVELEELRKSMPKPRPAGPTVPGAGGMPLPPQEAFDRFLAQNLAAEDDANLTSGDLELQQAALVFRGLLERHNDNIQSMQATEDEQFQEVSRKKTRRGWDPPVGASLPTTFEVDGQQMVYLGASDDVDLQGRDPSHASEGRHPAGDVLHRLSDVTRKLMDDARAKSKGKGKGAKSKDAGKGKTSVFLQYGAMCGETDQSNSNKGQSDQAGGTAAAEATSSTGAATPLGGNLTEAERIEMEANRGGMGTGSESKDPSPHHGRDDTDQPSDTTPRKVGTPGGEDGKGTDLRSSRSRRTTGQRSARRIWAYFANVTSWGEKAEDWMRESTSMAHKVDAILAVEHHRRGRGLNEMAKRFHKHGWDLTAVGAAETGTAQVREGQGHGGVLAAVRNHVQSRGLSQEGKEAVQRPEHKGLATQWTARVLRTRGTDILLGAVYLAPG